MVYNIIVYVYIYIYIYIYTYIHICTYIYIYKGRERERDQLTEAPLRETRGHELERRGHARVAGARLLPAT